MKQFKCLKKNVQTKHFIFWFGGLIYFGTHSVHKLLLKLSKFDLNKHNSKPCSLFAHFRQPWVYLHSTACGSWNQFEHPHFSKNCSIQEVISLFLWITCMCQLRKCPRWRRNLPTSYKFLLLHRVFFIRMFLVFYIFIYCKLKYFGTCVVGHINKLSDQIMLSSFFFFELISWKWFSDGLSQKQKR